MLFFQVLLLAGYAYAHGLCRAKRSGWRTVVHVALLVAALVSLPITPDADWKPQDGAHPTGRILILLLAHVGLPYFMLSTTGPLVASRAGWTGITTMRSRSVRPGAGSPHQTRPPSTQIHRSNRRCVWVKEEGIVCGNEVCGRQHRLQVSRCQESGRAWAKPFEIKTLER